MNSINHSIQELDHHHGMSFLTGSDSYFAEPSFDQSFGLFDQTVELAPDWLMRASDFAPTFTQHLPDDQAGVRSTQDPTRTHGEDTQAIASGHCSSNFPLVIPATERRNPPLLQIQWGQNFVNPPSIAGNNLLTNQTGTGRTRPSRRSKEIPMVIEPSSDGRHELFVRSLTLTYKKKELNFKNVVLVTASKALGHPLRIQALKLYIEVVGAVELVGFFFGNQRQKFLHVKVDKSNIPAPTMTKEGGRRYTVTIHEQDLFSPDEETSMDWTRSIIKKNHGAGNQCSDEKDEELIYEKLGERKCQFVVVLANVQTYRLYKCTRDVLGIPYSSFANALKKHRDNTQLNDFCNTKLGKHICKPIVTLEAEGLRVQKSFSAFFCRTVGKKDKISSPFLIKLYEKEEWSDKWAQIITALELRTSSVEHLLSELKQMFGARFYFTNIPSLCSSWWFGEIRDPMEITQSMSSVMTGSKAKYPNGCAYLGLWKTSGIPWFYYLVVSPRWDYETQKFKNPLTQKNEVFPCALYQFNLVEQTLVLSSGQESLTIAQINQVLQDRKLEKFGFSSPPDRKSVV